MILIGFGANVPHTDCVNPAENLQAAAAALEFRGLSILYRSRLFRSAPIPESDQPWFTNAVIVVRTDLGPLKLLALLHQVERSFGRVRTKKWEPRVIDLDLLAYGDQRSSGTPKLPHPRMHQRAFVLMPLADIAPAWVHPVLRKTPSDLIMGLGYKQAIEPLEISKYPINWCPTLL